MEVKSSEQPSMRQDIQEVAKRVRRWHEEAPYLITSSSVARVERDRKAHLREASQVENNTISGAPDYPAETFRSDISGR